MWLHMRDYNVIDIYVLSMVLCATKSIDVWTEFLRKVLMFRNYSYACETYMCTQIQIKIGKSH